MFRKEMQLARKLKFEAVNYIKVNRNKFVAGIVSVFVLAFFMAVFGAFIKSLILFVLMLIAVLPLMYKRWLRVGVGIEFMLFATVIAGINYGALTGFVFGAVAMFISDVMNRLIGEWTVLNMVAIGLGGVVASILGSGSILLTGMASVFVVEVIRQTPVLLIGVGKDKLVSVVYTAVHILFNLWLFAKVAPLFGL